MGKKKKETKKEKLKIAIDNLTSTLSDFIYNYDYTFAEMDIAYDKAKKKIKAEIQWLYDKIN